MAKKYFIRNGSVTKDGETRGITIVGCLDKVRYKNENGEPRKKRIFTYAYSIKHPDDVDTPSKGVELAVKRLKPILWVNWRQNSPHASMLIKF